MIDKIVARIQDEYIKKRFDAGTATQDSTSDLFFRPIREKGWLGIRDGWNNFQSRLVEMDESEHKILRNKIIRDFLTISSLSVGAVQVLLVLAGLNAKERASWDWLLKDFVEEKSD